MLLAAAGTALGAESQTLEPGEVPAGLAEDAWSDIQRHIAAAQYETALIADQPGQVGAHNPEQDLRLRFDAEGARVESLRNASIRASGATPHERKEHEPGPALRLQTLALARGAQRDAVTAVAPFAEGPRVEYRHDGWTEWYVNRAEGIEHGYTLDARPFDQPALACGHSGRAAHLSRSCRVAPQARIETPAQDERLRIELAVTGYRASQAGEALRFTDAAGRSLHYGKLWVLDADGKSLPATLTALGEDRIEIAFDDSGAKYPVVVDPLIVNEEQSIPNPGGDFDGTNWNTGQAVALDGDTLIIGAPRAVDFGQVTGAAYVFVRDVNGFWAPQARLEASLDADQDRRFGVSVALDGDTAVIGAFLDTIDGKTFQGSAYVFVRAGASWSQQQKLLAPDGLAGDRFGRSVALSGDTALIGAFQDDLGATNQGSAYVFVRSGTTWAVQQQLFTAGGGAGDGFGFSVALDGNTALIGAYLDDVDANTDQGSAYVYVRTNTTWTVQQQILAADGAAGDNFGIAVDVEGETALIGAFLDDVGRLDNLGSAHVFVRSGSTWGLQALLVPPSGSPEDQFGRSVALSGDTALIGVHLDDNSGIVDQGSAFVFVRSGGVWSSQQQLLPAALPAGSASGYAVALDGDTALIGAWLDDVDGSVDQGSARVHLRAGTSWTAQQTLTAIDGGVSDAFGTAVALSGNTALIGVPLDDVDGKIDQGSVWVFVRITQANGAGSWTPQARLIAADGLAGDLFGGAVAIDGERAVIGARRKDVDLSGQGAAYIFTRSGSTWTQEQRLTAPVGVANAGFGLSVAIDGFTALIGAPGDTVNGNSQQGAAYVFTRPALTIVQNPWSQQARLIAQDGAADHGLGVRVALDGDVAVVGNQSSVAGAAYIFERTAGSWTQQSRLGGRLYAVAVSGHTALVGRSEAPLGVAVYIRSLNGSWSTQAILLPDDSQSADRFGIVVALSGDTALIGASPFDPFSGNTITGSAYVFTRTGASWTQRAKLQGGGGTIFNGFEVPIEIAVALSGETALLGVPRDDSIAGSSFGDAGSARIYRIAADWGDAAAPYPNSRASDGARHYLDSDGPRLGSLIDAELNGQPDADATGDDLAGDDDEDGVSLSGLQAGSSGTMMVTVAVPGASARLDAWIDFNADGDWADVGERVVNNQSVTTGTQVQSIFVPGNAVSGPSFARVRLSTGGVPGPGGFAADGEVEDYRVTIVGTDSDGDGLPDDWEVANGLDPNNPNDAAQDTDGDGLSNLEEFDAGTDPQNTDTDGDGLGDGADAEPTVASNACAGVDAVFENTLVPGGTVVQCAAGASVSLQPTVTVESGGRIELYAPQTKLQPGFSLPVGAELGVVPEGAP